MTNTPMQSRNHHVQVRPRAFVANDGTVMNVRSIGGANYFVTFINEVSGHVRDFHIS